MTDAPARKPRPEIRFRRKVVIYATWEQRLLVFHEPDFPAVGLQVPGGTVEEGEDIETAARREFAEETGLAVPADFAPLGEMTYVFETGDAEAGLIRHQHLRSFFHASLAGPPAEGWQWTEQTPDGGEAPIRLAFSLVPLLPPPVLFARLDACLPALLVHLGIARPAT